MAIIPLRESIAKGVVIMAACKAFTKTQQVRGCLGLIAPALYVATLLCTHYAVQADPIAPATTAASAANTAQSTYAIQHALTVKDIPKGAGKVRIWFWVPQDDSAQKVLDFAIKEAPAGYKITRDPTYGHQYLYCEVNKPAQNTVSLATDFLLSRNAVTTALDPEKSGALTPVHQQTFADYLRKDTPYMEVSPQITKLAGEICGNETNVIRQARKIYDYVIDNADHYSKGETAPKPSKIGSVEYCRANGGGSCTDMHSLFSALARARNIPTRLYFGSRLQAKNEGKDLDPGYRCSVEFFAPSYGWVPVEVAAGDTNPDKKDFYFGGLDERRVLFNEGRDFDLSPKQDGPRINLFIGAYVEVDGKPYTSWDRSMKFTEVKPSSLKGTQANANDKTRISAVTSAAVAATP